jgi:ADP-ribose pyrophosphatase YjhB (NUDIX family)
MAGDSLRALLRRRLDGLRRRRWPDSPGLLTARFSVGAGALVRDTRGRILLVQQTYQRPPVWLPPGGWVGWGERPAQAAAREVLEELGLRVAIGRPLAVGGGGYSEVTILFECRLVGNLALRLSNEIARADFFDPQALPPMPEPTRRWLAEGLAALPRDPPSAEGGDVGGSGARPPAT